MAVQLFAMGGVARVWASQHRRCYPLTGTRGGCWFWVCWLLLLLLLLQLLEPPP
jgi:hypothetical protein